MSTKSEKLEQPEVATGARLAGTVTDKKGFAQHWMFSTRQIDNLLAQGLPHLKIGKRRVRIILEEGDAWMRERFATQRNGHTTEEVSEAA